MVLGNSLPSSAYSSRFPATSHHIHFTCSPWIPHAPCLFSKSKQQVPGNGAPRLPRHTPPYILLHVPAATCIPPEMHAPKTCFHPGCPPAKGLPQKALGVAVRENAVPIGLNRRCSAGELLRRGAHRIRDMPTPALGSRQAVAPVVEGRVGPLDGIELAGPTGGL